MGNAGGNYRVDCRKLCDSAIWRHRCSICFGIARRIAAKENVPGISKSGSCHPNRLLKRYVRKSRYSVHYDCGFCGGCCFLEVLAVREKGSILMGS